MRFVPSDETWDVIELLAPCPKDIIRITEAIPMIIPSMVSTVRRIFPRKALIADLMIWR